MTDDARCPACGEFIDYCQGHGEIGDPIGHTILEQHDDDDHSLCVTDDDGECVGRRVTSGQLTANGPE